jgi:hypothetical protein
MQTAFAEALLGGRHRCFGYNLRPFSAAHLAFLEAIGSPVVSGGKPILPDDLLLAAKVCAAKVSLRNGAYVPAVSLRPTLLDSVRLAWVSTSQARYSRAIAEFRCYLDDYLETPSKYETPGKKPRPMSAPAVFAVVVQALPMLGEERAWTMPFGLLRTYIEVHAESNGAEIRFTPDEEEAAQIERELAAAEEAGKAIAESIRKNHTRKP